MELKEIDKNWILSVHETSIQKTSFVIYSYGEQDA